MLLCRWNILSTVSLNFYQQQIPTRLLRPRPIWYLRNDFINVTSILRDCVGGDAATTSCVDINWGSFHLGVKRVSGFACSVLRSRDLQHGPPGAAGDLDNNGWTLFEQGRLHTRPHCRSSRLGNTTEAFICAAAAQVWAHWMKWRFTLWLFFVFGSTTDFVVFLRNFPTLVCSLQGQQHSAGWFIAGLKTVALTCLTLLIKSYWMTSFAATLIISYKNYMQKLVAAAWEIRR